ncbi:hypothetical protein [Lentzea atacamensis]|uniref:hypothetical protein n=1 Tax=Lentzea atacamensis TaxID=531938 RepID=UPI000D6B29F1|nr:hypothetical protein [Lentzea atacamensis]
MSWNHGVHATSLTSTRKSANRFWVSASTAAAASAFASRAGPSYASYAPPSTITPARDPSRHSEPAHCSSKRPRLSLRGTCSSARPFLTTLLLKKTRRRSYSSSRFLDMNQAVVSEYSTARQRLIRYPPWT